MNRPDRASSESIRLRFDPTATPDSSASIRVFSASISEYILCANAAKSDGDGVAGRNGAVVLRSISTHQGSNSRIAGFENFLQATEMGDLTLDADITWDLFAAPILASGISDSPSQGREIYRIHSVQLRISSRMTGFSPLGHALADLDHGSRRRTGARGYAMVIHAKHGWE
jgi:hypothetical protein